MPTNVLIFGSNASEIIPFVEGAGFTIVDKNPDIVISYGGDGTLMRSEHAFPGIPKLVLKGSSICKFCSPLPNEEILSRTANGEFIERKLIKLEARAKGKILIAVNDIVIHNGDPRHAIRYTLTIDTKKIGEEIIGDGIVVATPLGATGYYRSITDSSFDVGLGLAFNNSTEQSDHMVFDDDKTVTLTITRGPAIVYADNIPETIELTEGDTIHVAKSKETGTLITVSE